MRERVREYLPFMIPLLLIALLLLYKGVPFAAYGVPGISIHKMTQSQPTTKTEYIYGSYGTWFAYTFDSYGEAESSDVFGGRSCKINLHVELKGKIEVTDISSPRFLTQIKPSPFLIEETEEDLIYKNVTLHAYAYSFKVTLAWSGVVSVRVSDQKEWNWVQRPAIKTFEDLVKMFLPEMITSFNKSWFITADLLMSIDAPTLGSDPKYKLNPDYAGILGIWLQDYVTIGHGTGTATEAQPQSTGTAVSLFLDKELTKKCWALATPEQAPSLLTPTVCYWFDHYAPYGAYWKTSIVRLGSQLVFNKDKAYPNYVEWAYEYYRLGGPPAIAQWFRIDLGFRVTEDWTVPKIPEYEIPPEEKEKQIIIIKTEPENIGVPDTAPTQETITSMLMSFMPLLYVIVAAVVVVLVVYVVFKYRYGKR